MHSELLFFCADRARFALLCVALAVPRQQHTAFARHARAITRPANGCCELRETECCSCANIKQTRVAKGCAYNTLCKGRNAPQLAQPTCHMYITSCYWPLQLAWQAQPLPRHQDHFCALPMWAQPQHLCTCCLTCACPAWCVVATAGRMAPQPPSGLALPVLLGRT
jgi:hypothetical protein